MFRHCVVLLMFITHGITRELILSPYASWNPIGITVAGLENGTGGPDPSQLNHPLSLSISDDDILYVGDTANNRIIAVLLNSNNDKFIIGSGPGSGPNELQTPRDLFTTNTSLYILDFANRRVQKTSLNGSDPITVVNFTDTSGEQYLYVDDHQNIYVSDTASHKVMLFRSNETNYTVVAGTGTSGPSDNQLFKPYGIFLNRFDALYIADQFNHRIMKWLSNASSGIRVAGNGVEGTSSTQLSYPTQIIVDTNEYMYISEARSVRVTRWAPDSTFGVCIAACTGITGSASTQLKGPHSLDFDSHGSVYVTDWDNHRVQKFQILDSNVSYNRPKLDPHAVWDACGITLTNSTMIDEAMARGIFVSTNNQVYFPSYKMNEILLWTEESVIPTQISPVPLSMYTNLYVMMNEDIYFENSIEPGRIDKWTKGALNSTFVTTFPWYCLDLFIDINDFMYCSIAVHNRVFKVSLNNGNKTVSAAAGTGRMGSAEDELNAPWGIFVDLKFNLYVADSQNNRVVRFQPNNPMGVVVAGLNISANLVLKHPTDVLLDADDFLYIVDNDNHRIIRLKDDQYDCIIGCVNKRESSSNELNKPLAIHFDSYGNLYISDEFNHRIQKFFLASNSLNKSAYLNSTAVDSSCNFTRTLCTFLEPCQNNSMCINNLTNPLGYTCVCASGFSGAQCEVDDRICPSNPCENNGTCIRNTTNPLEYICTCLPDFSGAQCQIDDRICPSDPCQNNGTCIRNLTNPSGYICTCLPDFSGTHCQADDRICASNPCQNNGMCIYNDTTPMKYICQCPIYFSGAQCEVDDHICPSDPCQNNGTCIRNLTNPSEYICTCLPDFSGTQCEVDDRICASNPCQNNGRCIYNDASPMKYICQCPIYFSGAQCEVDNHICSSDPCEKNGTCIRNLTNPLGYTCVCASGFSGAQCQVDNRICPSNPCENNGTCIRNTTNLSGYICACLPGFSGTQCEVNDRICSSNSCRNNGTCVRHLNATFSCQCNAGWQGEFCEEMIDYCLSVTCANRGICCKALLNYSCKCLGDSYFGRHCEIKSNTSLTTSSAIQNCSAPMIALSPSSSLGMPLVFRPNQDIFISSDIRINCSRSSLISRQWTIRNWSSICSVPTDSYPSIDMTRNDLFIPARTLANGIYEFNFTVFMTNFPEVFTSAFVYIEIMHSTLITNLIEFDKSMIIHNIHEDLLLDPGQFSFDRTRIVFNTDEWFYSFSCRIYSEQLFRSLNDPHQSCFSIQSTPSIQWKYNNPFNSSVTIFSQSFPINRTLQWMIHLIHRYNLSLQSIGYLRVEVREIQSPIITISCAISSTCPSDNGFHYINPTSQLFLLTHCSGPCSNIEYIQWKIYQGLNNATVPWTLFSPRTLDAFYGWNTKNLTVQENFFTDNRSIVYWRFEVIYSFGSEISQARFDLKLNGIPRNGRCSINPSNGTILIQFTIHCFDWYDEDDIKDFTVYGWTYDSSVRMMLEHTIESTMILRLPTSAEDISVYHLVVHIRDTFDCVYEYSLPSVYMRHDEKTLQNFIDTLTKAEQIPGNDTISQLLNNGNRSSIGQLITSISHLFNEINHQTLGELALQKDLESLSMSITPLYNTIFKTASNISNDLLWRTINEHARVREYLMDVIANWSIITPDDLKFHSSILARLTEGTNELTRKTSISASNNCQQLSHALTSMATKFSVEEIYFTAAHLAECATNVFQGVNGLLQGRMNRLQLDSIRTGENLYDQKQLSNKILTDMKDVMSCVTSALNVHLNLNQTMEINRTSIYFSLEKLERVSLLHRWNISRIDSFESIDPILVRQIIEPLASSDVDYRTPSANNFSRAFSLSILDQNGREMKIQTNRLEFFIPRDPSLIIPQMFSHYVTAINETNDPFYYLQVDLPADNPNITLSIHLEFHPLNVTPGYILIYQFDRQMKSYSTRNWSLFCHEDVNNEGNYVHFLDNTQVLHHPMIIYGIRELSETEARHWCENKTIDQQRYLPLFHHPLHFTSDLQLRIYQSGCFHLDSNYQWQSDGLVVGPSTDHYQTQCFSTHLTTFTSAHRFPPLINVHILQPTTDLDCDSFTGKNN